MAIFEPEGWAVTDWRRYITELCEQRCTWVGRDRELADMSCDYRNEAIPAARNSFHEIFSPSFDASQQVVLDHEFDASRDQNDASRPTRFDSDAESVQLVDLGNRAEVYRLVTLVGPRGVDKTRLGLEAIWRLLLSCRTIVDCCP